VSACLQFGNREKGREDFHSCLLACLPASWNISLESSEKSFNNKKILMFPVVSPFRLYRIACLPASSFIRRALGFWNFYSFVY
jgi:hypothetical protein